MKQKRGDDVDWLLRKEEEWKVLERSGEEDAFMFLGNVRVANVTIC